MDYRTIDDMYDRGTLVRLTDLWTPGLARYSHQAAVVIDIEVLGYPRTITRQEQGVAISRKYDSRLHGRFRAGWATRGVEP